MKSPMMLPDEMPAFKFCPKCGSNAFFTTDKGRSFNCEDCHFQYFINSSAAVACLIFNSKGELLLTRRAFEPNKDMLDLPGGFVDPMETAEEAAIREIKEELNLDLSNLHYLVSFPNLYPFSNMDIPTVDLAFVCEIENFSRLKPGDDVASVEFFLPGNIDFNALCAESMRKIISYYIENQSV
jgi:NADH pyrophosphatase NudC (nudix superfamily)